MPQAKLTEMKDIFSATPKSLMDDFEGGSNLIDRMVRRSQWAFLLTGKDYIFDNPSLPVAGHGVELPSGDIWTPILAPHVSSLAPVIASVGRIEAVAHPGADPLRGTGWLVRPDLVVTNRHCVAGLRDEVASGEVKMSIDFKGEAGSAEELRFPVTAVEWFKPHAKAPNLDLAFIRIDRGSHPDVDLQVIELAEGAAVGDTILTIGYPQVPGQLYEPAFLFSVFHGVFGVKRLSPGRVVEVMPEQIFHNCTTLGGSSGAAIVDLTTGRAVAINTSENPPHNVSIPASTIRAHLEAHFP